MNAHLTRHGIICESAAQRNHHAVAKAGYETPHPPVCRRSTSPLGAVVNLLSAGAPKKEPTASSVGRSGIVLAQGCQGKSTTLCRGELVNQRGAAGPQEVNNHSRGERSARSIGAGEGSVPGRGHERLKAIPPQSSRLCRRILIQAARASALPVPARRGRGEVLLCRVEQRSGRGPWRFPDP